MPASRSEEKDAPTSPPSPATLTLNGGRRRFDARPGMTVFAACRTNGVYIATGCGARGRCGLCRFVVEAGDAGPWTEAEKERLDEASRARGERLACQARVRGDVALRLPDWTFDARPAEGILEKVERLTDDVRGLTVRLPDGVSMPFVPGQYMAFTVPPDGDRPGGTRCYSLADAVSKSAVPGGTLSFVVRHVPGGVVSGRIMDARVGDRVVCTGPYGDFRLAAEPREAVMVAGGSGLSPFFAMLPALRDEAEAGHPRGTTLFFGVPTARALYRLDELQAFARENSAWFRFVPVVADDSVVPGADAVARGLVTDALASAGGDWSAADGYLCGSPGMVSACLPVLRGRGIAPERIFHDRF